MNENFINSLLLFAVLWPLLLSIMLSVKSIRSIVLVLSAYSGVPALFAALLITPNIYHLEIPWLILGTEVGLDTTGSLFLLASALLWSVASIYTKAYFLEEKQQLSFYRFFLLAMAGNFG